VAWPGCYRCFRISFGATGWAAVIMAAVLVGITLLGTGAVGILSAASPLKRGPATARHRVRRRGGHLSAGTRLRREHRMMVTPMDSYSAPFAPWQQVVVALAISASWRRRLAGRLRSCPGPIRCSSISCCSATKPKPCR
jgi:hypothetical protein